MQANTKRYHLLDIMEASSAQLDWLRRHPLPLSGVNQSLDFDEVRYSHHITHTHIYIYRCVCVWLGRL